MCNTISLETLVLPKVENAMHMKNFRPIACCNTLHKCYSAILTNKLKKVIPEISSNTQGAFAKGRHILDNVLLMHEVVGGDHRKY